ncbi:MAG TPA: DUF2330 domain-containing protein, partial [Polyangiaceae bacterium]|nr:DUF2330 domain-containing protein [Polyangiaceae bacterium]
MKTLHSLAIASASVLLLGAMTESASACGGTFCDTGPTAMPVDQSGENILFVMDGQNVEAHVQIQYQGVAERFAWVVPMPKVPTVSVGSQLLFQRMLQGTAPTYSFNTQSLCGNGGSGGSATGGFGGASGAAGAGGGPTVVFKETVGAFVVTVLQGGTAQEVSDWLSTNNYQSIPSATDILKDYVNQNYVFVAIKMTAGASVDEIHPLVFKYAGTEPCVPLKLTAVAATEDMGVRTFFLGDDRVVPTNYKHITLNPVRIDWNSFASNYMQSVSRGADSAVANGRAFVTEYAGSSAVVPPSTVYSSSWNSAAFTGLAPEKVIDELTNQNLAQCFNENICVFNHPLLQPLLDEYLPVPASMSAAKFYSCLSCNVGLIDQSAWDATKFAADFKS